jgi:hypothetical protein
MVGIMRGSLRRLEIVLLTGGCVGLVAACAVEEKTPPPVSSSSGMPWGGDAGGADDGGGGTGSSGGGGSGESGCAQACVVLLDCDTIYGTEAECLSACEVAYDDAASVGLDCEDAFTAFNLCIGGLTCTEFEAYLNYEPPDSYPCKAEEDAVVSDCGL